MRIDIAFGQYCEGNSILHKTDPRFKLIIAIMYIVLLFVAKNLYAFLAVVAVSAVLVIISGIQFRIILHGLKPILFIIIITAVINLFFSGGEHPLVEFGIIHIYLEGVINSVIIIVRTVLLLMSSSILMTYTTTPIALTDAIDQLLEPLSKLRIPTHDFAMMMTIALRFIPTLADETQKIINAQSARGANFSEGNILKRAKSLIPVIIPLFVSAFRRAGELADAMESRCYVGGKSRTRMNVLHATPGDYIILLFFILLLAMVILFNIYMPGYRLGI